MTDEQAERLLKLAKLHDMQVPESLDMQRYFKCGTPSCSLGWATTIFPELRPFGRTGRFRDACSAAADFFGLSGRNICEAGEIRELFGGASRTPAEQAAAIRKVVAQHLTKETP